MTIPPSKNCEKMFSLLEKFFSSAKDDKPEGIRKTAWKRFLQVGLPNRKSEEFRYVSLKKLYGESFYPTSSANLSQEEISPFIYSKSKQSVLVFVNGCYNETLSNIEALPKQTSLIPLSEEIEENRPLFLERWEKALERERDPFSLINASMYSKGLFLHIPPKSLIASPIQILNIIRSERDKEAIMPRIHISCGNGAKANLLINEETLSGKNYWINQVVDVSLEENASLQYMDRTNSKANAWRFHTLRASLKKNAFLKTVHFTEGNNIERNNYEIFLEGENAETSLNGAWALNYEKEMHTNILIHHQVPSCRSSQLFKGILNDQSLSSFEGKIYVHPKAQKTEAFQLNKNLILSDDAQANSKPNLEILADDVKALHGATVGQLDEEQLYYLRSRGISEEYAKSLLLLGFCKEIINQIPFDALQDKITQSIKKCFKG